MNGKKARAIRKLKYGDYAFRSRQYKRFADGHIEADDRRQVYQEVKKNGFAN